MEGSTGRTANENPSMDRKGAQALTRFLTARHGSVPEVAAVRPLTATNAAPIFRWLGIEPPTSSRTIPAETGEPAVGARTL
jgi:hypothetical protein